MPIEQKQRYCETCASWKLFQRTTVNHLIHGIVTLFTCLVWFIPWMLIYAFHDDRYRCQACGSYPGYSPEEKKARQTRLIVVLALALGVGIVVVIMGGVALFAPLAAQK